MQVLNVQSKSHSLHPGDIDRWPLTIPAVRQLLHTGMEFVSPITFLVGENGVGKSTILEAIADAYGFDVRGGHGERRYGRTTGPGVLAQQIELRGDLCRSRPGFFLRAETALGVFTYMSDHGVPGYGERHLAEVSHGESFLQVIDGRFRRPGLYLLDEPEAALSFESCLALIAALNDLQSRGGQVICATHSPILTAMPEAEILVFDEEGFHGEAWQDLALVRHWRKYLADPGSYLRHLIAGE